MDRKASLADSIVSLLSLPAGSPELNPAEQVWQHLRDRSLANRCYDSYGHIVDACCHAWNKFIKKLTRVLHDANKLDSADNPTGACGIQGTAKALWANPLAKRVICCRSPSRRACNKGSRVPAARMDLLTTQA